MRRWSHAHYAKHGTSNQARLAAAGLTHEADQLRIAQRRANEAYEAGRLAEGDRWAARADVLVETIDNALVALEEEGEAETDNPVRSITEELATAWSNCVNDTWSDECRKSVDLVRETGHGQWQPPQRVFVGPPGSWGDKTRPEWWEERPGYYEQPQIVHRLRDIVGIDDADPRQLLDAAEDAYDSREALKRRIRHSSRVRRVSERDNMEDVRRFVRRSRRKKRGVAPNRTSRRRRTSR